MADLTWYSREGADQRFLTKGEAGVLATKAESMQSATALGSRIDAVKATAEAALPAATAAATYATKAEVAALGQQTQSGPAQPSPAPAPDLSAYATRSAMEAADSGLSSRIDAVQETADAALPAATASTTYATKAEVEEVRSLAQTPPQAPPAPTVDLSPYAKTADVTSADEALGKRIDQVSAVASAAAPASSLSDYATSASVAGTYATREALADYLKAADASDTYATKAQLAQAQIGGAQNAPDLSGLATKAEMRQADSALGARIDGVKATAEAALTPAAASSTYATKEDVSSSDTALGQRIDAVSSKADAALPSAEAASTYATQTSLAEVRFTAEAALPKVEADGKYAAKEDLAKYATTDSLSSLTSTYATSEALTEATKPLAALAGLPDKVSSLETAVQGKADSSALSGYLTSEAASSAYASKESVADLLPKADAATTYATKDEVAAVRSAIPAVPAAPDLSPYVKKADADAAYAAKADLAGYLTSETAATTYASKADLAKARAGGQVDLSGYVTTADAVAKFADKETVQAVSAKADEASSKASAAEAKAATAVQPDALASYATTEALAKVKQAAEAAAEAVAPPFRSGERYASPVTYYWPDYYNESKGTSKWAKALKAAGTLGIVILNKDSGNWDEKNEDFGKQAARALAAGARRAVFYVKTQYGVASLPSNDPARNGVPNPDKYTKEYILGQIAKFTEQYGDVAQGVFLDETINGWGAQAGRVQWYQDLITAIREQYGQNFYIVVNAGSNMSPEMCALDFDTAMMFEQDAGKFLNEDANAPVLPDHMRSYPSEKWWAVIHGVTKDNYRQVFEKLDTLPIGHAYITDGVLVEDPNRGGQWEPVGNPYANPPSEQLIKLTSSWIRGTLGLALEVEDLKAQVEALKKAAGAAGAGAGQAGKLLVLGPNDSVPAGTADDTVIIRREA